MTTSSQRNTVSEQKLLEDIQRLISLYKSSTTDAIRLLMDSTWTKKTSGQSSNHFGTASAELVSDNEQLRAVVCEIEKSQTSILRYLRHRLSDAINIRTVVHNWFLESRPNETVSSESHGQFIELLEDLQTILKTIPISSRPTFQKIYVLAFFSTEHSNRLETLARDFEKNMIAGVQSRSSQSTNKRVFQMPVPHKLARANDLNRMVQDDYEWFFEEVEEMWQEYGKGSVDILSCTIMTLTLMVVLRNLRSKSNLACIGGDTAAAEIREILADKLFSGDKGFDGPTTRLPLHLCCKAGVL